MTTLMPTNSASAPTQPMDCSINNRSTQLPRLETRKQQDTGDVQPNLQIWRSYYVLRTSQRISPWAGHAVSPGLQR
ncbi:uncharacterized protein TrAFT101_004421 [Trichoderma asperellum]|uniref:uncharacterized protein n=1 Tax=Trichoderma asperellum TaxID=101201 RepID=UPI00331A3987|nr:hypothetical protein TrAFT101_004421 [Trichoderma asperellum]